jgi:hypothetical protein
MMRPLADGDLYDVITPIFRQVFDDDTPTIGPETTVEGVRLARICSLFRALAAKN